MSAIQKNMKTKKGQPVIFYFMCLISSAIIFCGCGGGHAHQMACARMPEEIYISRPIRNYHNPRIIITRFETPAYAPDIGRKASVLLYAELLKMNIKAEILLEERIFEVDSQKIIAAHKHGFIVAGEILYFLNGMLSTNSQVQETIKIYRVLRGQPTQIGYAEAIESAMPKPSNYLLFSVRQGKPAPLADGLLRCNAVKFAKMIENMFSTASGGEKSLYRQPANLSARQN